MGNVRVIIKTKLYTLKQFVYNSDTGEILGRGFLSWGQLLLFFGVYFTFVGSFFAVHLAVFLAITPSPDSGVSPWNFGGYAYPNYPNSKLELISIPNVIKSNGTHIILSRNDVSAFEDLLTAANMSGVTCMNDSNNYGFVNGKSCVLVRVAKVFEWTPSLIQQFLEIPVSFGDHLDIACSVVNNAENITVTTVPPGIPLNIPNNENGMSFPFQNQDNYIFPLVGVIVEITGTVSTTKVSIECGIDMNQLGNTNWSHKELSRIYEIPKNVTIKLEIDQQNVI